MQIAMLWGGGSMALRYKLEMQMRGYYQVGPLLLESGDLFGLPPPLPRRTEPHYILVYPKVVPLQGYDLASRRPVGEIRLMHRCTKIHAGSAASANTSRRPAPTGPLARDRPPRVNCTARSTSRPPSPAFPSSSTSTRPATTARASRPDRSWPSPRRLPLCGAVYEMASRSAW